MSYGVPEDILVEILHRLPPKSIGKCMAVCKSWNFLIKSHHFSSSYKQQQRLLSTPLFLLQLSPYKYSLYSPNIQYSFSFSFPRYSKYGFVGALNGLVCFAYNHDSDTRIILLNPLTRRVFQLPKSKILTFYYLYFRFRFGFCFDSKKNDFKVINMCYHDDNRAPPDVELYSVNEGAWRAIKASSSLVQPSINLSDPELSHYGIEHCGQQLFYEGNVHWLAHETILYRDQQQPSIIYYILIFNVLEEKFNKMVLPDVLANSSRRLDITVIDGCLSLIEYLTDGSCKIWMKREYWYHRHNLHLPKRNIEQLLGQNTSSEVLVLPSSMPESLRSYDLRRQEMRNLGVKSSFKRLCASDFTYNLIFLDKESNVWDQDEESSRKRRPRRRMQWQKLIYDGYDRGS